MKRRMAARLCRRQNESTADHMMTPQPTYSSCTSPSVLKTHTGAHKKPRRSHFGKFNHSPSIEGPIVLRTPEQIHY